MASGASGWGLTGPESRRPKNPPCPDGWWLTDVGDVEPVVEEDGHDSHGSA